MLEEVQNQPCGSRRFSQHRWLITLIILGAVAILTGAVVYVRERHHIFHGQKASTGEIVWVRSWTPATASPVYTRDVRGCAVIIFEKDDFAVLGHATFFEKEAEGPPGVLITENTVAQVCALCAKHQIDPRAGRVIVDAGRREALQHIMAGMAQLGTTVLIAGYYQAAQADRHGRSVLYEPDAKVLWVRHSIRIAPKTGDEGNYHDDVRLVLPAKGFVALNGMADWSRNLMWTNSIRSTVLVLDIGTHAAMLNIADLDDEVVAQRLESLMTPLRRGDMLPPGTQALLEHAEERAAAAIGRALREWGIPLRWQRDQQEERSPGVRSRITCYSPQRKELTIRYGFSPDDEMLESIAHAERAAIQATGGNTAMRSRGLPRSGKER